MCCRNDLGPSQRDEKQRQHELGLVAPMPVDVHVAPFRDPGERRGQGGQERERHRRFPQERPRAGRDARDEGARGIERKCPRADRRQGDHRVNHHRMEMDLPSHHS